MSPIAMWVVGEPGVGKTTLVRRILERAGARTERVDNPKFDVYGDVVCAGHYNGDRFDGADTLAIHQIKPALALWAERFRQKPLTIFDGDKLSNLNAVRFIREMSPDTRAVCVWLTDRPDIVAARRLARGTVQDPKWVAGRATKAANFAACFPSRLWIEGAVTEERFAKVLQACGMVSA
jgi:hypothetical protein